MSQPIDAAAVVAALKERFRGPLLTAADGERYDRARTLYNAMFDDRRPALIAQVTGVADVMAVLDVVRMRGLPFAVRGGSHSVAGHSTIAGGVVIDLAGMKGIRVDPVSRKARAQAGVNWGEFDRETQAFGLATTGGRVTSTGLSGLTLGSGSGWLERMHGLTCDNLLSVDLVTADGRFLTASPQENPELFWGLRGGGGNFGIATEFEYRLHPVGPIILGGILLYPAEHAPKLLRVYRDILEQAPRELGGGVAFLTAPPAPFVPPAFQGQPAVGVLVAWFGPVERGHQVLSPLRAALPPPTVDLVQPMPYTVLQGLTEPGLPRGLRNYWRSSNMERMDDAAIDALVARAAARTSPMSQIILLPLGGAIADLPEDATALGGRSARWQYHCYAVWSGDGRDDGAHIAWVKATEEALRPHAQGGISLNFVSEAGNDRVRAGFGEAKYRRLVALKDAYDPTNLFRQNQNVLPSK
jgi:FAD/FMN-containing dehydrogenase